MKDFVKTGHTLLCALACTLALGVGLFVPHDASAWGNSCADVGASGAGVLYYFNKDPDQFDKPIHKAYINSSSRTVKIYQGTSTVVIQTNSYQCTGNTFVLLGTNGGTGTVGGGQIAFTTPWTLMPVCKYGPLNVATMKCPPPAGVTPPPCPTGQVRVANGSCVGANYGNDTKNFPPCPTGTVRAANGSCVSNNPNPNPVLPPPNPNIWVPIT